MGGGGGGAPAPKNPWDDLGVNTQGGYNTLQSGFNPKANIQQQGAAYGQLRNQGFGDEAIRSSVQSVFGQQPQDWYAVRRAAGPYQGLGVNTQQGFNSLLGAVGQTPAGSAGAYNDLLRQGFADEAIRSSADELFGTQSNANWNDVVTQAGLAAGRPLPGSAQFYQPAYKPQYQNYARPATQFDVSMYGTQPVVSPAAASGMSQKDINTQIGNYFQRNPSSDINSTLAAMRGAGINRTDIQSWGGVNNYGPTFSMPQMQTPFNPYTNNFGYGAQTPFSIPINYGPTQPIVSRSAGVRGTPNVAAARRAEGGIASLVDDE